MTELISKVRPAFHALFDVLDAQNEDWDEWRWQRFLHIVDETGRLVFGLTSRFTYDEDLMGAVDEATGKIADAQVLVMDATASLRTAIAELHAAAASDELPADIAAKVLLADELDRAFPSARLLPVPDAPQAVEEPEAAPVSAPAADEPTGVPETPEEWPSPAWASELNATAAPTPAVFTCDICGRPFPRRNHLTMHRRAHSDNPAIQAAVVREREEAATHAVAEAIKERERTPAQNERTEETFEERRRRFAKERVAAGRSGF